MDIALTYAMVSIAVLAVVVACMVFFVNLQRSENHLTRLTGMALALILAGLLFGNDRLIAYSFIGMGVLLAAIEMVARTRRA